MATKIFKTVTTCCLQAIRQRNHGVRFESSSSTTYKAAVIKRDVKDLSFETKERRKLDKNQVRIQVRYCSVNSGDLITFQDRLQEQFTPGYEVSGEVIEIGKEVTKEQVMVGEHVAGLSLRNLGGFAEECVLDVDDVFRLPSNVELKSAAVLPSGHATAVWAFSRLHELKKGDHVLITAGGAGLGLAAVDVAANVFGAKVIGVVDSEERAELVREKGAFETIKFDQKIRKRVLSVTDKQGASLIYDAVGGDMFESIGGCVATGGRIFHAAACNEPMIPKPPFNTYLMLISLADLRRTNIEEYRSVITDTLELADQSVIEPFISAKFDFTNINDAVTYIENKKAAGKVLITFK